MHRIYQLFPALAHRAFFCFIIGQTISMLGQWMQRLAMSWLVFRLTKSAFLLSIVEFMSLAPILVFGLMACAWLERHDLRKALITTQILCMLESALLTFFTFTDTVSYPLLVVLSLLLGIISSFDMTARQSSVSLMVTDQAAVKSAVALNSMAFNISKLVGPSIAGVAIYAWGEGICFLIATVSYLPILYMLLFQVRLRERTRGTSRQNMISDIKEGIRHIRSEVFLRHIFQLLFAYCFFGLSYSVLFPMFSTVILGGGSQTLGWLFGAVGAGAFCGGVVVSIFVVLRRIPSVIARTTMLTAAALTVFSFSETLWLSLAAAFCIGFGVTTTNISTNTLCQMTSSDDCRSRILSLYIMCTAGVGPVGGLAFGALADTIGAPHTMLLCAVVLCTAVLCYSRKLRIIRHSLMQNILHHDAESRTGQC